MHNSSDREEEEIALRMAVKLKRESNSPETSTTFHSENPCEHCENSDVYGTLIMKCPKSSWPDSYNICPICDRQIPEERNNMKRTIDFFYCCNVEKDKIETFHVTIV